MRIPFVVMAACMLVWGCGSDEGAESEASRQGLLDGKRGELPPFAITPRLEGLAKKRHQAWLDAREENQEKKVGSDPIANLEEAIRKEVDRRIKWGKQDAIKLTAHTASKVLEKAQQWLNEHQTEDKLRIATSDTLRDPDPNPEDVSYIIIDDTEYCIYTYALYIEGNGEFRPQRWQVLLPGTNEDPEAYAKLNLSVIVELEVE